MNLLIDIGNSFIKICITSENKILYQSKFMHDAWTDSLKKIAYPISKCIICDSGKLKTESLHDIKLITDKVITLTSLTLLPIEIDYETPETLGSDRIAAAVGAYFMFPNQNNLIFDLGTAITIDFIDSKGVYKGGNISPGIDLRFKSLHQFTDKLPYLQPSDTYSLTGKNTKNAIINGIMNSVEFEINNYIERYTEAYGEFNIILTGGDYNYFDKRLKNSIFAVPELIFMGLNSILEYNVK